MNAPDQTLLTVNNLVVTFPAAEGEFRAVDGLDMAIRRGEVVCLVGESGSGKSVTGFSIMGLIDKPGKVTADMLSFDGHDMLQAAESELDSLRGRRIAMIFQEPMTALNPGRSVGNQIAEVFRLHERISAKQAWERAVELMDRVGIRDAAKRASSFPHELSGGMRQRVMIAIACAMMPDLIIADEPTTALDVTVQAQVLELLFTIQAQTGSAVLFITHDLGVVAEIADRVIVMRKGRVVEQGDVGRIFANPEHPYTQALLAAVPDVDASRDPNRRLSVAARGLSAASDGVKPAPQAVPSVDGVNAGEQA